jgi:hypothetical protein
VSSAPYGSINPTPHKQAKNKRRALIVRRHRAMLRDAERGLDGNMDVDAHEQD